MLILFYTHTRTTHIFYVQIRPEQLHIQHNYSIFACPDRFLVPNTDLRYPDRTGVGRVVFDRTAGGELGVRVWLGLSSI